MWGLKTPRGFESRPFRQFTYEPPVCVDAACRPARYQVSLPWQELEQLLAVLFQPVLLARFFTPF